MCTMIAERVAVAGGGKRPDGWFDLSHANVTYDHPFYIRLEHALNIDFVSDVLGPSARVAVELEPDSARALAEAILTALARGDEADIE